MTRIGLIGPGKVGRSIALALPKDRYTLGPVLGRRPYAGRQLVRDLRQGRAVSSLEAFRECQVVLLTIPEAAMPEAIGALCEADFSWTGKTLLHTCRDRPAGLTALAALGASIGDLFPMQLFHRARANLHGVHFVLSGDGPAVRVGRAVVRAVRGQCHVVRRERKPQAAAAASIASDVVLGVVELAVRRLMAAGLSRRRATLAIRPIVDATLDHCQRSGSRPEPHDLTNPDALTNADALSRLAETFGSENAVDELLYRRALRLAYDSLEVEHAELLAAVDTLAAAAVEQRRQGANGAD